MSALPFDTYSFFSENAHLKMKLFHCRRYLCIKSSRSRGNLFALSIDCDVIRSSIDVDNLNFFEPVAQLRLKKKNTEFAAYFSLEVEFRNIFEIPMSPQIYTEDAVPRSEISGIQWYHSESISSSSMIWKGSRFATTLIKTVEFGVVRTLRISSQTSSMLHAYFPHVPDWPQSARWPFPNSVNVSKRAEVGSLLEQVGFQKRFLKYTPWVFRVSMRQSSIAAKSYPLGIRKIQGLAGNVRWSRGCSLFSRSYK